MTNQQLAKQFEQLTAALQVIDPKKYFFQIRSYQKAITVLSEYPEAIADVYAREQNLEQIDGIGPAIEEKIVELLTTGKSDSIEQFTQLMPPGMFPLLDIPGVGAKRAHKLATIFGIENPKTAVSDLEKIAKDGKIRELEGFGEKSEKDILDSISRLRNSVEKMPYEFAYPIANDLAEYLRKSKFVTQAELLGSLRRHKKQVGDIDLGLATENFVEVKKHVKEYPKLIKVLADGENLIRILLENNIQVDVKSSPPQRWGAFIQHFTGSKDHNIKLRELALRQGKSLSEHGIKLVNEDLKLVEFADEVEFYKYLGLNWIEPEERLGGDEIEKAKI